MLVHACSSKLLPDSSLGLTRDDHGRTALHWAAASGLVEAAQALLTAAEAARRAAPVGDVNGGDAAATPAVPLQEVQVITQRFVGSLEI